MCLIFLFCVIEYFNGAVALETKWHALVVTDRCVLLTASLMRGYKS